jgi:hypothetical protein
MCNGPSCPTPILAINAASHPNSILRLATSTAVPPSSFTQWRVRATWSHTPTQNVTHSFGVLLLDRLVGKLKERKWRGSSCPISRCRHLTVRSLTADNCHNFICIIFCPMNYRYSETYSLSRWTASLLASSQIRMVVCIGRIDPYATQRPLYAGN